MNSDAKTSLRAMLEIPYLRIYQSRIRDALSTIEALEAQVAELRTQLTKESTLCHRVIDERAALRVDVVRLERDKADLLDRITNTDAIQIVSLKQTVARLERENAEHNLTCPIHRNAT